MRECIFCNIINKKSPADIIYEDDRFIVFKDIRPQAPVDLLVVPKLSPEEHLVSANDLEERHKEMIGNLILLAKKIAENQGISDGYRLVFNVGRKGGQEIDHFHFHLLGGWK